MTQFFIALLKFHFIFRAQNFFWFVGAYSFAETYCSRNHKWLHINTQEGSETGKAVEAVGKPETGAQLCNAMQCTTANIRLSGRATCCSTYFEPFPHLLLWEGMGWARSCICCATQPWQHDLKNRIYSARPWQSNAAAFLGTGQPSATSREMQALPWGLQLQTSHSQTLRTGK